MCSQVGLVPLGSTRRFSGAVDCSERVVLAEEGVRGAGFIPLCFPEMERVS